MSSGGCCKSQATVVPGLVCTRRGKEKDFIKGCGTLGCTGPQVRVAVPVAFLPEKDCPVGIFIRAK